MPAQDVPYKYTAETVRLIENALKVGADRSSAARAAGLERTTLARWMKDDSLKTFPEQDRETKRWRPIVTFREMVEQAEGVARVQAIANLRKAAAGGGLAERRTIVHKDGREETIEKFFAPQWTASAWFLERGSPDEWRARAVTDMTKVSDDELLAKMQGMMPRFEAEEDAGGGAGLLEAGGILADVPLLEDRSHRADTLTDEVPDADPL
jgi:hypothetical protein